VRIAAISDLHVIPNDEDDFLLAEIRKKVEEIEPDVFVVAGDLSDDLDTLSRTLGMLRVDDCENLFVAGNHDVWFDESGGPGSLEKYSRLIGQECRRRGFLHLPDAPFIADDLAFIGSVGWYDYSFRREDMDIPIESYEHKEHNGAIWYDLFRIDWTMTDVEATEIFNRRIEYDLSTLPDSVRHVVYVSHHLPFQELTIYKDRLPWDFHSAFMGAKSTGEVLLRDGRVLLSISGHSHIRNLIKIDGLTAMTVPLGYGRPDREHMKEFIREAVAEIHIEGAAVNVVDFVSGDICAGLPYVDSRH